jgi:hypothetical protein
MTTSRGMERLVATRAAGRCEYCRMHQALQGATFHVEHVIPRSRGGPSTLENLAWACPRCNLQKTNRVEVLDPATGTQTRLYNPRVDVWQDNFRWDGFRLLGLSDIGRATIETLDLNHPRRMQIRQFEELLDFFPPDDIRD